MVTSLLLSICFTSSFILLFPFPSSATRKLLVSSTESSENRKLPVTVYEQHLYELNSLKAAGDVSRLAHGHGSGGGGSGGMPENNNGGGNMRGGGGAAIPVIIAAAANNNRHPRKGAATCNSVAKSIYWRVLLTLLTAAALTTMWKPM